MQRRLSKTDYENIYTYAEEHGYGSNVVLAETYGISKQHIGLIVIAFRCIMNNTPIRNSNVLRMKAVLKAAKQYRLQKLNSVYSPVNTEVTSVVNNIISIPNTTSVSFIDEYVKKNECEIEALRTRIQLLEENIRIAKEFANRLS